uniref:Uncharacterized protein n=1 Tax=Alexandrium catenella TaxID=2925 RepID=A0A7S1WSI5_ALECA|mmetsp:Transcript_85438/g.226917  ORF Transcript_85438/g.226917 Transcript_85438/m.226917 type:complete len:149 (+) Transcript_85438:755-1201(+)
MIVAVLVGEAAARQGEAARPHGDAARGKGELAREADAIGEAVMGEAAMGAAAREEAGKEARSGRGAANEGRLAVWPSRSAPAGSSRAGGAEAELPPPGEGEGALAGGCSDMAEADREAPSGASTSRELLSGIFRATVSSPQEDSVGPR